MTLLLFKAAHRAASHLQAMEKQAATSSALSRLTPEEQGANTQSY